MAAQSVGVNLTLDTESVPSVKSDDDTLTITSATGGELNDMVKVLLAPSVVCNVAVETVMPGVSLSILVTLMGLPVTPW